MSTLADLIPEHGFSDEEAALDAFLEWVTDRGIEPYPAQEEAFLEIFAGNHLVLETPTGSGKSLVAVAMHFRFFARARRSVYTAPIKALVSEKFFALCEDFGAEHVGMMTGDGAINPDAPILCCTAEVLSKMALRHGELTPFHGVVMDEFHYYGDRDRGMAWQVPLLTMTDARFLLMSATLGDTSTIRDDLTERTGAEAALVTSTHRPVPLSFSYSRLQLHSRLDQLVRSGKGPVYAVCFTQKAAADLAGDLLSTNLISKDAKAEITTMLRTFRFDSPYGKSLRRVLSHGVGIHHAGLLPKYRLLVEKLAQQGAFAVICGTDTLGVGINVPIRTVLFTRLCKFDGEKVGIVTVRAFKQIAGRAGRKGFDDEGFVVAQAPEHVIENLRLKGAIDSGKKKKSKVVMKKPPTRGYKHWDEETFDRLVQRAPSKLRSRFHIDHGLVLALLQRAEAEGTDPVTELGDLIDKAHVGSRAKERLAAEGAAKLEQLVTAGVVVRDDEHTTLAEGLQEDFSLHHSLSLFLVHALAELDPEHPEYGMDVISLVEAILEHPRVVLRAQVHRAKGEIIGELKAAGVPYEERMEAIEDVTWPKPRGEWIYTVFNTYADSHPWLAADHIRPKSVVRELVETAGVFSSYVKELGLERAEGVLLRYLTQAYKTLIQNVPLDLRSEDLEDAIGFLRAMLARVDDSLLTAWEGFMVGDDAAEEARPVDISSDPKRFRARVRAELLAVVKALSNEDWDEAAASVRQVDGAEFTGGDFEEALAPYLAVHGRVVFDGRSKLAWNTIIEKAGPHQWTVRQVLVDDDEDSAWSIDGQIDLVRDTNPAGPLVQVLRIGE